MFPGRYDYGDPFARCEPMDHVELPRRYLSQRVGLCCLWALPAGFSESEKSEWVGEMLLNLLIVIYSFSEGLCRRVLVTYCRSYSATVLRLSTSEKSDEWADHRAMWTLAVV